MLRVAEEFHGSHTGRQRRANEDSFFARSPLFAVADGMGGAQAGEIASATAIETLGGGIPDGGPGGTEERMAEIVRRANERIHELSRANERQAGMGTTMTAVLVGEHEITVAHVGDSRAYRLRDGKLERITDDHSLVEELVRQGRLTPEEANEHPQRSVITRALGPEPSVEVDTSTWPARDGDVYLLCSDGLTAMVDEPFVERTLLGARSLDEAGNALIDAANDAGGRDNITVILVRLEDVGGAAGASGGGEQETAVGRDALRTSDVQAALEAQERGREGTGPVATMERTDARAASRRLQPTTDPPPAAPQGRRSGRLRRTLITLAVLAVVLVPVGIGVFAAVKAVYFIGTDDRGYVTIYRGVPYELPLGVELYEVNYTSGVPQTLVPAGRREGLLDQSMRSRNRAYELVRELEQGRLATR
jgi:serine/threonine protein phosphatase PrpC